MRTTWAIATAGAVFLAGCGGTVEDNDVVSERWDPCSLPQGAISATGLDPEYRIVGWPDGIRVEDWSLCKFRAPAAVQSYFFNVMSSDTHTVDEARTNDSYRDGADLSIGGRDAFRYRTDVSEAIQDCNIAVAVVPGVVVLTVDFVGGVEPNSDPCDLVLSHAMDLNEQLPLTSN